jgi:bifunctional DNA-binding transcriptional regulator/antitoxin component of YhaV-PrlF toxin-antitoxin module
MIKKIVEPTGDVCIKFTEEELLQLGLKQGDKLSFEEENGKILLQKFCKIDVDMSEWNRDILEFLISESCEKDISINEVISNVIEKTLEDEI